MRYILTVRESDIRVELADRPPFEAGICRGIPDDDDELKEIVEKSLEIGRKST